MERKEEEETICQNHICGNVKAWQYTLLNTDALWFTPMEINNGTMLYEWR